HEQICQSDVFFLLSGAKQSPASPLPHRLDESATGYSSVGLLSSIARLRFTGWLPCCTKQPKQSSTSEPSEQHYRTGLSNLRPARQLFGAGHPKKFLPEHRSTRYNKSCPGFGPLAGFEVIMSGRFWGDHRGSPPRSSPRREPVRGVRGPSTRDSTGNYNPECRRDS